MRATTGWLMLGAAAAWGLTVFASEKPPESYVKNMKETNAAAQELRKNLDAKSYDGIAKNAAALKTLFANTQSFWEERKMEDAVGFAKSSTPKNRVPAGLMRWSDRAAKPQKGYRHERAARTE